jgi:hypothetical protein
MEVLLGRGCERVKRVRVVKKWKRGKDLGDVASGSP